MSKQPKEKASTPKELRERVVGGAPAPIPLQRNANRMGLHHLPGNWSNPQQNTSLARGGGAFWGDDTGGNALGDDTGGNATVPRLRRNLQGVGGSQILVGMGYHSDLPDFRDYGWDRLDKFLKSAKEAKSQRLKDMAGRAEVTDLPEAWNLGDDPAHPLSPIENQGHTNTCTAQAAAGLIEYLYRWATGDYNDFSRMFIYFNSRRLLGWSGDIGCYIRTTFKAMRLFGAPPEPEWPFDISLLDTEPLPYHYAYASNFKTLKYARLDSYQDDPNSQTTGDLYDRVKRNIYAGFPVEFGFPVYSCIQSLSGYTIPIPSRKDRLLGGHAVLAVGYDDTIEAPMPTEGLKMEPNRGALIIRN